MKGPDRNPSSLKLPASTGLVLLRRSGLELVRPLQDQVGLRLDPVRGMIAARRLGRKLLISAES